MTDENRRIRELESEVLLLQEQLKEANASNMAKETFLSSMSHDIRTPMNAIVGLTALAKKHIDEKARVLDALEKIETASGHLLALINGVLDMSRINSGRMKLSVELFALSDLLHDTLTIIRPQVEEKGQSFHLEMGEITAESFYGDSLRLRQILVNILSNAVKYTNEGGEISLYVGEEMAGDLCRLNFACTDNGIGMSEEFLQRIFDPFERVSSTTVSGVEGTGLGMSIVKKLVEAMDGTITVESREGEGTKVSFVIPLPVDAEGVRTEGLAGKRILILEEGSRRRDLFAEYLGEAGVEYRLVSSAAEAFEALADADFSRREYHAVVIGGSVPIEKGLEIARYLHKSFPDLVLVLAGSSRWEEIEYRAGQCGIRSFLPLPFFRKSLLGCLSAALTEGEDASGAEAPDLAGMRILLAEDNMINREIAQEILESTGAQVESVENGLQALERFLASDPGTYNLVLMDIQMPVMDGYTAARRIRESGRTDAETIPVYAMTANTFAEDIAKARNAGMNGHLAKPIDIPVLMQTLRTLRTLRTVKR